MIILIPLGGTGERFKKEGYIKPKALIDILDKPILFYLLDNLNLKDIDFIYIPYNKEYSKYDFENKLRKNYPNINFKFFCLKNNTRGAAETIYLALHNLDNDYKKNIPILCLDSDNFYTCDIISMWNKKNTVFMFYDTSDDPKYSYILHNDNYVKKIVEKNKISNNACTGAYGFNSLMELYNYCLKTINKNILQKGEFYISNVIQQMIEDNINFVTNGIINKHYFSLGTPKQINEYKYSFLFDLDGTLVNTDDIYIEVWKEMLKQYKINVTKKFFNNFIKGKNDNTFLIYLLPNISQEEIQKISMSKDMIFIDKLKNVDGDILLDGVLNFFEKNKNRKIAVVTSSNKKAAEYILKKTKLDNYIQVLISADDCKNHKPDPEPYLKAINILNIQKENCIIFEDSISGYCSAKNTDVLKICLICNDNSSDEILNTNEFKITNYNDVNINNILLDNNKENKQLLTIIYDTLNYLPIKKITKQNNNLKTGYICNVDTYSLLYNNNIQDDIILKISNFNNDLSKTAIKLNMYKNETYFYNFISKLISEINIPKFYGSFEIDNKDAILLENLYKYNGKFNIDLNNNIFLLLSIINNIFNIHYKFYFEKEEDIIISMKELYKPNQILYYKELIQNRFDIFMNKNKILLSSQDNKNLINIYDNFDKILNDVSEYPLSFCHGDLKSPNIFYMNNNNPYFLDWQYIQLNKGVSDIAFLLVESINFDENIVNIVINFYYKLIEENKLNYSYTKYIEDFKNSLCVFPFFVCVWFNSEDSDKLLDSVFPIRFMKNLLKYYDYFL